MLCSLPATLGCVHPWLAFLIGFKTLNRLHQIVLIGALLPLCWLAMQVVHEGGHVLGAWLTGGQVQRVVLHPLAISRTDLAENPHPLFVTWAGPVVGCFGPLLAWALAAYLRWPGSFVLRFFAGFCLVANGAYLAGGSLNAVGDAGDLLRHGASVWQLWAFGLLSIPAGFAVWNGQGADFGIGKSARPVSLWLSYACLAALVALIAVEQAFFR